MKSYFNNLEWTPEGNSICSEIEKYLRSIYERELDHGMNVRELTSIVVHAANSVECRTVINAQKRK